MEQGMTILENTNAKRIKRAYNAFMNSETRFQALYNLEQLEKAVKKYNQYAISELRNITTFIVEQKKYIMRCLIVFGYNATATVYPIASRGYIGIHKPPYILNIVAANEDDIMTSIDLCLLPIYLH